MKRLNEIINCNYNTLITGIKTDSRDVGQGDLFVAIKGFNVDHYDYIRHAIKQGAVAVVTNRKIDVDIPVIIAEDVSKELYLLCSKFYNKSSWDFSLIGITGTDGKTTTATMIRDILKHIKKSAYFGTNGIYYEDKIIDTNNTTPLLELLYEKFDFLNNNNCEYISLEVSSESLLHGRVDDLSFKYAVLTNISEDHLNVHKTMKNYIDSKAKLFSLVENNGYSILNLDDEYYNDIAVLTLSSVVTYGMNSNADFVIGDILKKSNGYSFSIKYQDKKIEIESPYDGLYNIYNLTAAFIVCFLEEIDVSLLTDVIRGLKPVPGRGEYLDFSEDYNIVLDYAHTANGIKSILGSLNERKKGRLIAVLGSAGGREKEKRSVMGKVALDSADLVVFTMDDPRFEKVSDIIDDLISDSKKTNYLRIENRKEAIFKALSLARENDIVAILGKGRDTYMAIGDEKQYYSDYDSIVEYFKNN